MLNDVGPSSKKRMVLSGVVHSIVLYGVLSSLYDNIEIYC